MINDSQYSRSSYQLSQRPHKYGGKVYLVDDPYLTTLSMQLSDPAVVQPRFNEIVREMYQSLFQKVANICLLREQIALKTRMHASTPHGVFAGEVIAKEQRVVLVDLARAGIVPTDVGLNFFSKILSPANVRIDHIFVSRAVDQASHTVIGANVAGTKIGGDIDNALMLIPDPMGATGSTVLNTLRLYEKNVAGKPRRRVVVHLIAAPESIKAVHQHFPDVEIFTVRLDRGLSDEKILQSVPGTHWDQERGLNDHQYIVPGAGGVGELMNNSFV